MPQLERAEFTRITLLSQGADPTDLGANNPRPDLSVGLVGIRGVRRDEPAPVGPGVEGFQATLAAIGVTPSPTRVSSKRDGSVIVELANVGTAYWPVQRDVGDGKGAVFIDLRWRRLDGADETDARWPLLVSMLPGDRTRVRIPIRPISAAGTPIHPGRYDVRVGMVRESAGPFAERADGSVTIPVMVEQ